MTEGPFRRPPLPRGVVPRPHLVDRLDRGVADARLTLISAPAGSGKTVLLSLWSDMVDRDAYAVAWLWAADDRTFWPRVLAAVASAVGADTDAARSEETPELTIARLCTETDHPVVIVVDDFHEITSTAVLEPLKWLLRHAPANLRLVLACRRDPDLAIYRFRLNGELAELRNRDLAFSEEEAAALFAVSDVRIEPEQVRLLVRRTRGWAAALRFAEISMRDLDRAESFVNSFARTDYAISDYLVHEVLACQTEAVRDFLLRTSVCDHVTGELANAITGRSDGAVTLAALERDNVFVEGEARPGWYRYHPLFLELLRTEARLAPDAETVDVHRAAARWLAQHGEPVAALRHAAAAGDALLAGELLADVWVELVGSGDTAGAVEFLDKLPATAVRANPHLCLLACWQRLAAGDAAGADSWLARADGAAQELEDDPRHRFDAGRSAAAAAIARRTGDLDELERAMNQLAEPGALLEPPVAAEHRRTLALCARGALATWRGELDEAGPILEAALDAARRMKLRDCELDALSLLALACALRGELKRAERLGRLAGDMVDDEPRGPSHASQRSIALAARAFSAVEWDDLQAAHGYATAAREAADVAGDRVARFAAVVAGASSFDRQGLENHHHARLALAGISDDNETEPAPPVLASRLLALRSRLALAAGDLETAYAALGREGSPTTAELAVAHARVALARGETGAAANALEGVLSGDARVTLERSRVEAAVLHAVAAEQCGDGDGRRRWLEHALELAEPEGFRAPFFEAGPSVCEMLRDAIRHGTAHRWLAGVLLAAFDGHAVGRGMAELLEPLSDRERVVLRYLPTIMSNQEIAGELFVSVSTVKTHLRNIYRKLGSSDRREAVRRARDLRLVT